MAAAMVAAEVAEQFKQLDHSCENKSWKMMNKCLSLGRDGKGF